MSEDRVLDRLDEIAKAQTELAVQNATILERQGTSHSSIKTIWKAVYSISCALLVVAAVVLSIHGTILLPILF